VNLRRSRLAAWIAVPVALALALAGVLTGAPGATAATTAATFTNFEPAGLQTFGPDEGGGSVGTKCPGAGASRCYNVAGEPAIRADEQGNFYAASENGLGAGTEAWKSTDGGRHYVALHNPGCSAGSARR